MMPPAGGSMNYRVVTPLNSLIEAAISSIADEDKYHHIEVQYLDSPVEASTEKLTVRFECISLVDEQIDCRTLDGRWFRIYNTNDGLRFSVTPPTTTTP